MQYWCERRFCVLILRIKTVCFYPHSGRQAYHLANTTDGLLVIFKCISPVKLLAVCFFYYSRLHEKVVLEKYSVVILTQNHPINSKYGTVQMSARSQNLHHATTCGAGEFRYFFLDRGETPLLQGALYVLAMGVPFDIIDSL